MSEFLFTLAMILVYFVGVGFLWVWFIQQDLRGKNGGI